MSSPEISVVMPVRDAAATVEAAARSILEGSHRNLELLAIDDGSTDGTMAVLDRLARGDPRVRVLATGGAGLLAALELGHAEAQSKDFIARMDADDVSLPTRFEAELLALKADPTLWAVGTQVEIRAATGAVSPNLTLHANWMNGLTTWEALFADRLVEGPLCNPSSLMRRAALDRVGGWKDDGMPEDWAVFLRMIEAGGRLRAISPVLFHWFDHPGRVTRNHPRYAWGALQKLKARHLVHTLQGRPATIWGAGELGLALFRELRSLGVTVTRFIDVHPRKVGRPMEGLPVVSPEDVGPPGATHLIAAVGAKGARAEIRAFLAARGYVEGRDFTCAG
jgi:glycosyltransferase involved in cell wall biosynthesis